MSKPKPISHAEYNKKFGIREDTHPTINQKTALEYAIEMRKFEIELYWKRATYFWTFIAACFVGYAAIPKLSDVENKIYLSLVMSCLGFIFSFAWFLVNKGSKQWQENWENHVDMLEDAIIGPLFKTIFCRPKIDEKFLKYICKSTEKMISGPSSYSVSKINQIISLFVTIFWGILICHTLPRCEFDKPINCEYALIIIITIIAFFAILAIGKSNLEDYKTVCRKRYNIIKNPTVENK